MEGQYYRAGPAARQQIRQQKIADEINGRIKLGIPEWSIRCNIMVKSKLNGGVYGMLLYFSYGFRNSM